MYRVTKRAAKVRRKWEEEPPNGDPIPVPAWKPGDLLRVITVIDYSGQEPRTHAVEIRRTRRVDTLLVKFDNDPPRRMGWSKATALIRKALPRELSPRHYG